MADLPQRLLLHVLLLLVFGFSCGDSEIEWIRGARDQQVIVGEEIVFEIRAAAAGGERVHFSLQSDATGVTERAELVPLDDSSVAFRWTPLAKDIGTWHIDVHAHSGGRHSVETFALRVLAANDRSPRFQQPIGAGMVLDLEVDNCLSFDVVVDDPDSSKVVIAMEEPLHAEASLTTTGPAEARFVYCPQKRIIEQVTRRLFRISADDGDNPRVVKSFLVLIKPKHAYERVSLAGWTVFEQTSSCAFLFPPDFKIARDSAIVIGRNASEGAFRDYWQSVVGAFGANIVYFDGADHCFKLSDRKEQFSLYDNSGRRVDGPTVVVGRGRDYQRLFYSGPAPVFTNWSPGAAAGASPGVRRLESGSLTPYISEVSDVPEGDNQGYQFIEITIH